MADTDQIQALGQQLATALIKAYGANVPGGNLVFLPGGVSVPDDLVQGGVLNPTQMQTFLSMNFNYPFVVTKSDASVLRRDEAHGTASQVYSLAVSNARPVGNPNDDAWKRIAAEIAGAQQNLGPPATQNLVCVPDDWPLPSASGYWTTFDSTQSQSSTTSVDTSVPVVNPRLWMLRSLAVAPLPIPVPPAQQPTIALSPGISAVHFMGRMPIAEREVAPAVAHNFFAINAERITPVADSPVAQVAINPAATMHLSQWRLAADQGRLPEQLDTRLLFSGATEVRQVTTSTSSTVAVHLEHQCVTLGRFTAGQPWWDGVFLSDMGWYVPGMGRGGLLPAPDGADTGSSYGLPIAMILVQNLRVSGQWSQNAATALSAHGGTIGPLSLFGAVAKTEADGVTVTYAHTGMQVVALLCSPIPVLPPIDTPAS
jgi:hypothetical protein